MKYYMYYELVPQGEDPVRVISEKGIIDSYYEEWCEAVKRTGKLYNISEQNCIDDWCISHWAIEVNKEEP